MKINLKNHRKLTFVCAGVSALIFALILYFICIAPGDAKSSAVSAADPWDALEKSNFDPSSLYTENGLRRYTLENGKQAAVGIDVSEHHTEIDWPSLAGKIDFCMVRAGYRGYEYGLLNPDDEFDYNMRGAAANGIDTGVYFFSQAITADEAQSEARYVIDMLSRYDVKYPVVYDMERLENARAETLSTEQKTDFADIFCKEIKKAGYIPMVYGNVDWLLNNLDLPKLKDYGIWLAEYDEFPYFPYKFDIWQYTDSGSFETVDGAYDLNICFTEY